VPEGREKEVKDPILHPKKLYFDFSDVAHYTPLNFCQKNKANFKPAKNRI